MAGATEFPDTTDYYAIVRDENGMFKSAFSHNEIMRDELEGDEVYRKIMASKAFENRVP